MYTEYVYIAKRADGLHKIGCTGNIKKRVYSLGREHEGFEIVHTIETNNALDLEGELHSKFSKKRKDKEWFALTSDDLLFLFKLHRKDFPADGCLISGRQKSMFMLSPEALESLQRSADKYGISKTYIVELAIREFEEREQKIRKDRIKSQLINFANSL
jgi:hypothetical protein